MDETCHKINQWFSLVCNHGSGSSYHLRGYDTRARFTIRGSRSRFHPQIEKSHPTPNSKEPRIVPYYSGLQCLLFGVTISFLSSDYPHRTTFEKCATGRFLLCSYVKICQLFSKLSGGIFQC